MAIERVSTVPYDRIAIDPSICHGQACVKGTRMPVHQIVRMLANGDSVEDCWKSTAFCHAKTSWRLWTTLRALPKSKLRPSK